MSFSTGSPARAFLVSFLLFASTTSARAAEPDELIPTGDLAETTEEQFSTFAPPRHGGLVELSLSLAAGHIPFHDEGNSMLVESAVTFRAERPYYLRASLGPTGGTFDADTRIGSGMLSTGLDTRFFELGVGVGVARADDAERFPCGTPGQDCTFAERSGPKLTLGVEARLGTRDGVHITTRFVRTVPSTLVVGAFELGGQMPLVPRVALSARATIAIEYGYVQLGCGVRARIRGEGGSGTLYLTPGASWTGFVHYEMARTPGFRNSFAGSLNVEYRL